MTSKTYRENFKRIVFTEHDYRANRKPEVAPARSHLPAPMIAGDYKPYQCPITGREIDGRREHRENLAKHDCRILERGEFEDTKKNGRKRIEEKIDRAIDKAIDKAAAEVWV